MLGSTLTNHLTTQTTGLIYYDYDPIKNTSFSGRAITYPKPSQTSLRHGLKTVGKVLKKVLDYLIKPFYSAYKYLKEKAHTFFDKNKTTLKKKTDNPVCSEAGNPQNSRLLQNLNNTAHSDHEKPQPISADHNTLRPAYLKNPEVKFELPDTNSEGQKDVFHLLHTVALMTDREFEQWKKNLNQASFSGKDTLINFLKKTRHELLQYPIDDKIAISIGEIIAANGHHLRLKKEASLTEMAAFRTVTSGNLFDTHYCLEKKLGEGTNGEVFLLKNTINQFDAVLKIVNKKLDTKNTFLYLKNKLGHNNEFICGEGIGLNKNLKHQHCPQILGLVIFNKRKKTFRFVNEARPSNVSKEHDIIYGSLTLYERNATPADRFFVGNRDPELVKRFGKKSFESLAHLHENGVYHQDIKPANMLAIQNPGQGSDDDLLVPIIDFQNSFASDGSKTRPTAATPSFAAPEVITEDMKSLKTEPCLPAAADVWSMGVSILYIMAGAYYTHSSSSEIEDELMMNYKKSITSIRGWSYFKSIPKFSAYYQSINTHPKISHWINHHRDVFDLLDKIFVPEDQRISAKEAAMHKCWK